MRKVILSKTAARKLSNLLDYLTSEFSETIAQSFVKKLDAKFDLIKRNPEAFPKSKFKREFQKCVVTKQTSVFYGFDEKHIYVYTIFDTRQDPKKL